jgi:DNA-binding protein H-NS
MTQIDLSKHNLNELKELQSQIQKEMQGRQQQEVQKAREQIIAIAQDLGMSVEALIAGGKTKSKGNSTKSVQAKFQNPADSAQTWSGRGRQPRWVAEGLASGKTLQDFKI